MIRVLNHGVPKEDEGIDFQILEKQCNDIECADEQVIEEDLSTALELLGRVSDMFSFMTFQQVRAVMGSFHAEKVLELERDVTKFLNTYTDPREEKA